VSAALPVRMVEKPWGRDLLPPPFAAPDGQRIGEIWFEPPPALPQLLVKYLFTSEKLSVQVHPSDDQAEAAGLGRQGKEECWLVLSAEPGATLGIGFDAPLAAGAMRAAALDGSIERLMTWHAVAPGDFFYIPAGTVHAIGPGVSLIEIQQNSDITYRLFDYGRPRELHLEAGVAVARGEIYPAAARCTLPGHGTIRLVDGPHFRLDRVDGPPDPATARAFAGGPLLVIPLAGTAQVAGEPITPGQCALAAGLDQVTLAQDALTLLAQVC
jgi:mannose-6-phosphate isomerase